MKLQNFIIMLPLFLVLLFLFGLYNYIRELRSENDLSEYDGVAVLAGGDGRLIQGIKSLDENLDSKLIISGVGKGFTLSSININEASYKNRIEIGRQAKTTYENAVEISDWAKRNNYLNIRVITSAYHMPRSILQIKKVNSDLNLIPYPVFSKHIKLKRWWRWPGTFSLLCEEYFKLIFSYIQSL